MCSTCTHYEGDHDQLGFMLYIIIGISQNIGSDRIDVQYGSYFFPPLRKGPVTLLKENIPRLDLIWSSVILNGSTAVPSCCVGMLRAVVVVSPVASVVVVVVVVAPVAVPAAVVKSSTLCRRAVGLARVSISMAFTFSPLLAAAASDGLYFSLRFLYLLCLESWGYEDSSMCMVALKLFTIYNNMRTNINTLYINTYVA